MAIRNIREIGDSVLTKTSREVKSVDKRLLVLIDDMLDTLYDSQGVGLAAPQIGVLKRVIVIDISEEGNDPIILINPEIMATDGSQVGDEGCLSVPGKVGTVERPNYVKVKAYDKKMKEFTIEGTELLARALCHEIDHLNGELYVDKITDELRDVIYQTDDV
ncbi:MAG: peptide deformylase [Herbinix sp.]|jgi:peptide deformylase|nr:peptide deformylase [Herbinix sp.]